MGELYKSMAFHSNKILLQKESSLRTVFHAIREMLRYELGWDRIFIHPCRAAQQDNGHLRRGCFLSRGDAEAR